MTGVCMAVVLVAAKVDGASLVFIGVTIDCRF